MANSGLIAWLLVFIFKNLGLYLKCNDLLNLTERDLKEPETS